jgi:TRAP-type C4-dicarboxylate transport system substrate-binding protein
MPPRAHHRLAFVALAAALLSLLAAGPALAGKVEIKLATSIPANTPFTKLLDDLNKQWQSLTGGDVSMVVYAGGVQGDESDALRKMRIGQLHAGAITVASLSDIDDYFSVFQIPLFFDSWDELNYVLDDVTPLLAQRLEQKGLVLLSWGHVGMVYFFTKTPVERIDDLRKLKIFTWAGNERMIQWWQRNGFNPVAVALPDALQGLRTGLIETMIAPPLAALSLQWFKEAPNMIDIGLAPLVGAVVVDKRTWERIDEKYRTPMLAAAGKVGNELKTRIPSMDQFAITTMKNQGLRVLEIRNSPHSAEWMATAKKFADEQRGDMVPPEIFDRALKKRDEFRAQHPKQQSQPAATGASP